MTAWTVYWVLQADTIGKILSIFALGLTVPVVVGLIAYVASIESNIPEEIVARTRRWLCPLFLVWLVMLPAATFMPSTDTLAAMYILPKLANNEQLQQEEGDVCELAIQVIKGRLQTKEKSHED